MPEPLSDVEEPASRDQEAKEFIEEVLFGKTKASFEESEVNII